VEQIKITLIISIVSILLVGILLAPFMSKVEERKMKSLRFFLQIDVSVLKNLMSDFEAVLKLSIDDQDSLEQRMDNDATAQ